MCDTTTMNALQAALAAILGEVIDYPAKRPYDSESHLPIHLVEQASATLVLAGYDVGALQQNGGAA